jgi:predicted DCC family thiol-disulfide oxidoreductase YuxK
LQPPRSIHFPPRSPSHLGANPSDLDTFYVVINRTSDDSTQLNQPDEQLLSRSDAVLFVMHQLGGSCRAAAFFLRLAPKFLRDRAYNAVARHRYRIFGRSQTCILPAAQDRIRFLDL